jgi:hypothetical protein
MTFCVISLLLRNYFFRIDNTKVAAVLIYIFFSGLMAKTNKAVEPSI